MSTTVLVTGGAGYIGSHCCVCLLEKGYNVVVIDNLSNSCIESINRIQQITEKKLSFHQVDLLDVEKTKEVFEAHKDISVVIHFAGLKAVGESVSIPLKYYRVNVNATLNLLDVMEQFKVNKIIFSSSASVYGEPQKVPLTETHPLNAQSPYGKTKQCIEGILKDWSVSNPAASVVLLRYFNPVGAHSSGSIGENPIGVPMNLMPFVAQVAIGQRECVRVFGNDYPTPDGTGVRDYIHVVDLVEGHLAAFSKLSENGCFEFNLGLGRGYSVLEMISAMSTVVGKAIPYVIAGRRAGDVSTCFSDCSKAEKELKWKATRELKTMCEDLWRWQTKNPKGYN